MNGETKQVRRRPLPFPDWKADPGHKKWFEAVAKCGLPNDWIEISRMVREAKTKEELDFIEKKLPMRPPAAIVLVDKMGKDEFLAQGYNLEYVNELFGGPEWMDRYV